MTPEGQKDLAAVIAEMRGWRTSGMGGQTAMQLDNWADRLALLLAEAPQVQEFKEDTDTRVDDSQYDPPSAGPLATAAGHGVKVIAAERQRQIDKEGWTSEHDDAHTMGELAQAAAAYASVASAMVRGASAEEFGADMMRMEGEWPWDESWWKPSDNKIRTLAKAGALIAAEIDRLQRLPDLAVDPHLEYLIRRPAPSPAPAPVTPTRRQNECETCPQCGVVLPCVVHKEPDDDQSRAGRTPS